MTLKKQAIVGVKWSFLQQFSVQIINLAVQIVLARLLLPEMFGLIAMVMVFVSVGTVLMDSGMTSSLIRTNSPNDLDYSTVFITNLVFSFLFYVLIFISAPYVANFYEQELLSDILRVLAISFVIRAFVAVHLAKLTKEMNFKLQMHLQVPSVIVGGVAGIVLAYAGYGVWSLVWLNIIQAALFTIQSWVFIPWRPRMKFSKSHFDFHFKFGFKVMLSSLVDTVFNDSYRIVIGKFFSTTEVGYFNQAETMRLFPVQQISSVLGKVTYPYFSRIDDDVSLRSAYKKTMKLVMFLTMPIVLALILVAEEGFRFVFGEKWLPAVIYFQILSIASIVRPVSSYNLNILKVKGRSDLLLYIEIAKKIVGCVFLVGGLFFGMMGVVVSLVLFSYFSYFMNMYSSGRLIGYSTLTQLRDISTISFSCIVICLFLFFIKNKFAHYLNFDIFVVIVFGGALMVGAMGTCLALDKELRQIIKGLSA